MSSKERNSKRTRKSTSVADAKRLYALSGNVCEFPQCPHPIFDLDGTYVAQLCHIEAAQKGGERFNPAMTDEQRASFDNLMFLCNEHHVKTDDESKYTVDVLRQIKSQHEVRFNDARLFSRVSFVDQTELDLPTLPKTLKRLHTINKYDSVEDISKFAEVLRKSPRQAREILCILVKRLRDGEVRFKELLQIINGDQQEIATLLNTLDKYELAYIDVDHWDSANPPIRLQPQGSYEVTVIKRLDDFALEFNIDIVDLLVDMRFDLLD